MKHIRRDLYSNRIIYRKYAKNYHRHNMNILTFLKSNYKYKRRNTRCYRSCCKQRRQLWHLPLRQQQKQKYKHRFPVRNEEILTDDKQTTKKNSIYENIKLDKFLRIFMLIMQQATTTTNINNSNNCNNNNNQSKGVNSSRLVTRLVAKMKAIKKKKKANKSLTNLNEIENDRDEIENKIEDSIISEDHLHHHYAHKDANKDSDNNIDISNIGDEISHQLHNYDKVSTITSTPIKCHRRKDHQIQTINSFSLITTKRTVTTTATSPSIANYKTCQCSAILHHYDRHNSTYYYHPKIKHIHTQYHQHHHQALHLSPRSTTTRVLNINNSCNNTNKNKNENYKNIKNKYNKKTTSVDQYVSTNWNRSYTLSCLMLTIFVALSVGVRSTTAGACWQTVLDNGKCNEIFSLNISKSECCGANQEFAYTEREPTNVEYFFATAIGGGMECSPCLESCKNVKCGPNKKCAKRKGRPKCICAPECGAARRKRKQREHVMPQETPTHSLHLVGTHIRDSRDLDNDGDDDDHDDDGYIADMAAIMQFPNAFKIKIEKSQQSRDTRSLSSEITNVNLGLKTGKDTVMMINSGEMSPMEKHHCKEHNQNQRKTKYMQMHHTHTPPYGQLQQSQDSNHKNQEPKESRRLLITANVEHTEKPTTRRLQILSNVRTTNTRRYNRKKNQNEHGPDEDTDPLDYIEALEEEENNNNDDRNYKYNDAEDDVKEPKKKNLRNNNNNSNGNSNSNKYNRNDDSTRFINQSMSRHKLKTNTKSNNHNNSNNGRNRNSRNNNKKNQHDLQRTKIQQHSGNNNTRIRHPQQNGRHAENTPHYRHHHHNHHQYQQQQFQPHHRQQQQQHNLNHNHQQQSPTQGRHKHNKQQKHHQQQQHHRKQQTIVSKMPKNNKDYNSTTTANNISVANATSKNNSNNNNNSRNADATITATSLIHQSRLAKPSSTTTAQTSLNLSSATSFLSSTTPVNSTMSANYDDDAAADDHNHSRLQNHGNKLATSSISPSSAETLPSTSSHLQLSAVSAHSSPEPPPPSSSPSSATTVVKMSAKGEGVSLNDQSMHHIQIPTKIAFNNDNINKNNDNIIPTFQSNLHNTQQQKDQQQHQTQSTQEQQHQHYQTPLFDSFYEQFDLIGFKNKQQQKTITNEDNVRSLNPVCGTDGRTYNTECQLRKRACRTDNPNLQISYRGHCRTTCNGVQCLNGLTCVEDQYLMPYCIACKIECPQDDYDNDVVDATKAVCGADGKTYKSTCDINRMICKIGRSIGVAYPGPCREEQVTCDDINCGPKQVCLIDLLTHKPRCTSCRYKCSRKRRPSYPYIEEGKICGVNNRTYNSWCEMRKDSCSTGFYIDTKYSGACH